VKDRLTRVLVAALGARPWQVALLEDALARDYRRRADVRARKSGLDARAVTTLLALYLALGGIGIAAFAIWLRAVPDTASFLILCGVTTILAGMAFGELYHVLFADEGYRVIAAWSVDSASYLAARLVEPTRRAIAVALLMCGPAAMAMAVASGTPVVTAAVFLVLAVALAVAVLWIAAGIYVGMLSLMGARRVRLVALVLVAIAAGYAVFGVPATSIALHVAMLALLSEVVACELWSAFPILPFSRPAEDDELTNAFVVAGMLVYVLCALIATFVIRILYRWWAAYAVGALYLLAMRARFVGRARARGGVA